MTQLPTSLLRDIWWCFAHDVPGSRAEMLEDACFFASFMDARNPKRDLLRQLPFSDVRLRYEYGLPPRRSWDQDEDDEDDEGEAWRPQQAEVRVVAGPLSLLTGVDLLWDLHLAIAPMIGECHEHFLVGLELEDGGGADEPPTYRVVFGS